MRTARKLMICGLEYRVVYATGDKVPELVENEGWCDTRTSTIYVRANMPPSRMRDTLLHEVCHAFIEASGVDHFLRSNLKVDEPEFEAFEETLVRLIVPSLLRLIDDNGSALIDVPIAVSGPAPTDRPGVKKTKKGCRR